MADTPEQEPAPPASGGESGGEQPAPAAPTGGGGGIKSFLPLIIIIVLTPLLAVGTIQLKSWWDKRKASAPTEEPTEAAKEKEAAPKKAEAEGGHGAAAGHGEAAKEKGKKKSKGTRNTKLPIPLTRDAVAYHPKDDAKEGDSDKFVVLDLKGEPRDEAKSDKIVVNIANTQGSRFAVARLSMVGEHADLVERVNQSRERLLDVASGSLSSKSIDDAERPGFRNLLRQEFLILFNDILGRGTIQEVVITEFIIQ